MIKRSIVLAIVFTYLVSTLEASTWLELVRKSDKSLFEKDYVSALSFAEEALAIGVGEDEGSALQHAVTLGKIGQIYFFMGDLEKAEENLIAEMRIKSNTLGLMHPSYSKSLNNLGFIYQYTGKYQSAENVLLKALEIKKDLNMGDNTSYAVTLHNLAKLYQTLGRYSESENYYLESLRIKSGLLGESDPSYAKTLLNLGVLYKTLGNYEEAESNIQEAGNILKSSYGVDDPNTILAEIQLAMVYLAVNEIDKATEIISELKEFTDVFSEKSPDYPKILYDNAIIQWSLKNHEKAEELLLKVKPIIEKQYGKSSDLYSSCLNSLGIVNWHSGNLDEAYKYLTQVVVLRGLFYGTGHPDYATSLHNLAGISMDMNNFNLAKKYYLEAISIYHKLIDQYFSFLSEAEKSKFYTNMKIRFDMFYNFIIRNMDKAPEMIGDMYNNQLSTKAILLNNILKLRNQVRKYGNESVLEKYDLWKSNKEKLAKMYSLSKPEMKNLGINIDSLQQYTNSIEKELSRKSQEFEKGLKKNKVNWEDIRDNLMSGEAAVEIIRVKMYERNRSDKVYYVAMIIKGTTDDQPEYVIFENGNKLEIDYIKQYKKLIKNKIKDEESYKHFWLKIDKKLEGIKKVYFSPDGVYNKINISSLLKSKNRYVLDEKNIVLLTNTKEIAENPFKSYNSGSRTAYFFGAPAFNLNGETDPSHDGPVTGMPVRSLPEGLNKYVITPLPGTKKEVENINTIAMNKDYKTEVFLEESALKNKFKMIKGADIIHIATHGYFLPEPELIEKDEVFGIDMERIQQNPLLRSGLLFAGAENTLNDGTFGDADSDNGVLTAFEVKNLDLEHNDLLVLSACETGLGEVRNGEGVYGLQRAFKIAGSNNIIMSLWKVDDNATQELMEEFYKRWLDSEDKREAFTNAQKMIKEKYKHPYYWGAFVMIGR